MNILMLRLGAQGARRFNALLIGVFLNLSQAWSTGLVPVALETKTGVPAWFLMDANTPVVNMVFAFEGSGSATDPADKAGRAALALAMLTKGAGPFSNESLEEFMQQHGLGFSSGSNVDDATFSMNCLKRKIPEAKQIVKAILYEPRFFRAEWKLLKQKVKTALAHREDDAYYQASETFFRLQFKNHPYATADSLDAKILKKMRISDLKAYREKCLVKSRLHVVVTGDLTVAQAADLVDDVFADLPQGEPAALSLTTLQGPGSVIHIPAERPQTLVYFAQAGLKTVDADFIALNILLDILAGRGMESRLGQEMREKRGLVYGVSAWPVPLRASPLVRGSFQTASASLEEAVSVLRKEWDRIHQEGVTAQELESAKSRHIGSALLAQTSSAALANTLLAYQVEGRPIDYGARRAQLIESVTLEQINALAHKMLDPKALALVVVGPQALGR